MDVYNNKRFERQFPSFGSWESYDGIPFTSATIPFQTSRKIADREKGSIEIWVDADDLDRFPRMRPARMLRPKPVDEDLYQVPVQLVHAKAKREKRRYVFFTRCLLSAICLTTP